MLKKYEHINILLIVALIVLGAIGFAYVGALSTSLAQTSPTQVQQALEEATTALQIQLGLSQQEIDSLIANFLITLPAGVSPISFLTDFEGVDNFRIQFYKREFSDRSFLKNNIGRWELKRTTF